VSLLFVARNSFKTGMTLVAHPKTKADSKTGEGDAPPETAETENYK